MKREQYLFVNTHVSNIGIRKNEAKINWYTKVES